MKVPRSPRDVGKEEFSRLGLIATCEALAPGAVKTLTPEMIAALYDNTALAMLQLTAELGGGFVVTPEADGAISIHRLSDR